ncbi:3-keto-5-aminohexanoate cleavage protein [Halobacteria archaeon AArc-m2/3/4]|uniref:3-keto-5-aminohexanoate cleavage protein n=1 Tax=Natronoglomus mannanivorans TaxID=2979990 RepID=A0AAP2Z0W5_9EURY|nr:3-keto-5-aminohexanoate cleavage protein [Halobacteria archaeon AArc-xg1-1]MCU4973444.1 3-keto-5-aminohexanoate cleavage protein [Halobacteria archaeon AArc-m2/3/4]
MSYDRYLAGEPLIVTAALTGGVHGKEANPNLPETPEEIGRAAAAAEAAGASVVHLHARKPNGERSFATERFQAIDDAVRAHADDIVVQHSTGGTAAPDADRHLPLRTDPPPEMASLDMGPLNRYEHLTSENTRGLVDSLHEEMVDRGIKPELEVFNDGHLNEVFGLLERRDLAEPVYATLIFGPGTLTRPRPGNFLNAIDNLPEAAQFNTLGFGRHQLPFATMGILFGGHVRVGLEDNVYYRKGELATSNAQLVERVARLADELGRPVATPEQAREILGI